MADENHTNTSLLNKAAEFGHGNVNELALVPRVIARQKDAEVIKDDPPNTLCHGHESDVTQNSLRIHGTKAVTKKNMARANGSIKRLAEILLRDVIGDVEWFVGLDGHET